MFRDRLRTCSGKEGHVESSFDFPKNSRLPIRSSTFSGNGSLDYEKIRKLRRRIKKFFSDPGDDHANVLCDSVSYSSISEEVFPAAPLSQSELFNSESSTDGRRRRQNEGLLSPDAPESLVNKSFLQKKITPAIRRTRSSKQMSGKENRPFVDMTSLIGQGGNARQPESDVGNTFFVPAIETPDMLDLSSEEEAIVRPLHHSILGKEHCFEVITVNGSRCFCCKSAGEREAWIEKIKRTLNPNLDNSRRMEYQLNLWVQEAKGIPIKKKYFCEICLDRQLYARTTSKLKDDSTTFWGEHFDFTSIPYIENITVHLYKDSDKKKKKDKDYVGLVNISVQTLANRQTVEKWYTLSTPSGNNKNKSGETMAIRIKARFQSVCVLPMEQYKEFAELISQEYMQLCRRMRSALTVAKKDELSKSLVSIMHATGTIKEFMTEIVMNDIANVEEESLIFRENTIATKAVEHFLRLVGMGYLQEALGDFVHTLYESEEDCEVDGSRLPANAVLDANQKNLQMCCEIAMCKIINSIKIFPHELREVFSAWRVRCESCNRSRIASRLVTASLFLRLLCPAILNPSLFGLANELPRPNAARTLTLVAKVIQNLANRTRFGDKEEYMKFMNGFVREQWDQMGEFIDGVSDATKPFVANGFEGFIDLGRELAKLHAFFTENLPTIDQSILSELGELPDILAKITDRVENPPTFQNPSRSPSHISTLDKITEDAHLSNANDNIMLPPDSTSTPMTERRGLGKDTESLMDLVAEGFPPLANNTAFSHHGSQTSIPATGSFNNSNNSHRPSLASTENLTELTAPSPTNRYQPPAWIQQSSKPPLSFSNPAYQQRHPVELQRGVSSPASISLTALDNKTDQTVPNSMKFLPSNVDDFQSLRNLDKNLQQSFSFGSSSTVNNQLRQPVSSAFKGQQQPLSFTNPLQILQNFDTNLRASTQISQAPLTHSKSQLETVFTTETVTYATKPLLMYRIPTGVRTGPDSSFSPAAQRKQGPVKMLQDSGSLDRGSSGADSVNDSFHSNESLSSRPSSTTTGSTATSGTANNHTEHGDGSRAAHQRLKSSRHPNTISHLKQNLPQGSETAMDTKPTAIATSTNIPVASAKHRTGLQKQQQSASPSKSSAPPYGGGEAHNARRASAASETSKASARASRATAVKDSRAKAQHMKYPSLELAQIEQDAVLALNEVYQGKKDEDQLVSGKPVTSIAMNASSATRVRMPRKNRSNPANTTASQSHNQKLTSTGDKYHGGRWSSQRGAVHQQQASVTMATEPPAFPPATPEGPLSPEERTAQWILSSVAPAAKESPLPAEIAPASANYLPSKMKTSNKDVKSSDARLQERVRAFEDKIQRQAQEKEDKKNELLQRMNKVEVELKREREELQGVIDEKDMIVSAQRKRIDSLEEANARLLRAVSQLKDMSKASGATKIDGHRAPRQRQGAGDQSESFPYDVTALLARQSHATNNTNNNSRRHSRPRNLAAQQQVPNPYQRRPSGQAHTVSSPVTDITDGHSMENGAPTASFINGELRIGGLSSGGSSSSSV